MACCRKKNTVIENMDLENSKSITEGDEQSKNSTAAQTESASKTEGEDDPDALSTSQVVISVVLLCLFALSFATSFFLLTTSLRSLNANFTDTSYTCEVDELIANKRVECPGTKKCTVCIIVMLKCEEFNDTKIMYEYYQDYYTNKQGGQNCLPCSATRCSDPDKIYVDEDEDKEEAELEYKYAHSLIRKCCTVNGTDDSTRMAYAGNKSEEELYGDYPYKSGDSFQYDQDKPEAIFYKRDNPGTNSLVLSPAASYFIIITPQAIMFTILVVLLGLFVGNKMSAKEIYRPITTITPLHVQINGKWYIKDVKPEEPKMNAFEKLRAAKNETN